jgi:UDP-GlcNAc:undecaprenyl-phosphate GlcNAc-1-phosphate transferase
VGSAELLTIAELCAASAAITAVICFYAPGVGRIMRVMDKPDGSRKLHDEETPLIGGLALLVPTFAVSLFYSLNPSVTPIMLAAVGAASATLIIGIVDDRKGLSPILRVAALSAVIAAVLIADPLFILHTLVFKIFGWAVSVSLPNWLAAPFVLFMILGFVNAANMADGMNGQLLGSVTLWSVFIVHYLGPDAGLPFIILICSTLVTLAFNLRGRLFAGSSGAYAAALFVGLGAIAAYRLADGTMAAQVPVYWFWLPVIDCVRLMVTRILKGRSPFAADRNHFHHMLLDHMRARHALLVYLGLLAAPGAAAMLNEGLASVTLLLCVGGYFIFVARELHRSATTTKSPRSLFGRIAETVHTSVAHQNRLPG